MFWEISINRCYDLNRKCPPQACAFGHLVPSWWRYFGKFWNLWECGLTSQLPMGDGPFRWCPLLVLTDLIFGLSALSRSLPWTATQAIMPSPPWSTEPEEILPPLSCYCQGFCHSDQKINYYTCKITDSFLHFICFSDEIIKDILSDIFLSHLSFS